MRVYLIIQAVDHEADYIDSVWSTRELAEAAMVKYTKADQSQRPPAAPLWGWRQTKEGWRRGSTLLHVEKYEVDPGDMAT